MALTLCVILFFIPRIPKASKDLVLLLTVFLCSLTLNTRDELAINPQQEYCSEFLCKERLSSDSYIIAAGRTKFYLNLKDTETVLKPGDSLFVKGRITPIRENGNTETFSYARYLKQKGVFYTIFSTDSIRIGGFHSTPYTFFQKIREVLLKKIDRFIEEPVYNATVKALCLGYKNDLESTTQELFRQTGTVHLLAVSGLHTGAVYLLIVALFKLCRCTRRKMRLLIIPILWSYACITGLSPSVVRAAQILTFIIIGDAYAKDYSSVNFIAASALLTLIVDPHALYSLSMQMSYAAYTGIIIYIPVLNPFAKKLPRGISNLYTLCCLSAAAQLTTLPLCAFYFHSFSINSILVNILAVPLATLLLYGTIALLLFPGFIAVWVAFIIKGLCYLFFNILHLFNKINILAENLYPTPIHLILIYLLLFLFTALFVYKKRKMLCWIALAGVVFICYSGLHNYRLHAKKEIVIFHIHRHSCIVFKQQGHCVRLKDNLPDNRQNQISPYIRKHKLSDLGTTAQLRDGNKIIFRQNRFQHKEYDAIYIIDRTHRSITSGIAIITDNIPPDRLSVENVQNIKKIILDGSCSYHTAKGWEEFCKTKNIPLQNTRLEGSIRLELK